MFFFKMYVFKPETHLFYPLFTTKREAEDFRIWISRLEGYCKDTNYQFILDPEIKEFVIEGDDT